MVWLVVDVVTLPDWLPDRVDEDAALLRVSWLVNKLEDALEAELLPEADWPVAEVVVARLLDWPADLLADAVFSPTDWLSVVTLVRLLASLAGEIQLSEEADTSEMDRLAEVWVKEPLVTAEDEGEGEAKVDEVEVS